MRIIPGNTKVQIEIFKGLTLWDMLAGAIAAILLALIVVSTMPCKLLFISIHLVISVLLLSRFDKEPNYMYLIHIIRHLGYKRRFDRMDSDERLYEIKDRGEYDVAMDEVLPEEPKEEPKQIKETKAERKLRLKAEKAERKADDKLLKSKKLTKEEEDAIWLKRAQQSAAKKEKKKAAKTSKKVWAEMEELSAFTGIADNFIEYGNYYGAVLEIPCVEFRFFSEYRRTNSIENGLGTVLRSMRADYSMNLVKIERPVTYDSYIAKEIAKLDELRKSYEEVLMNEEELKARVAIVYDRIEELQGLRDATKVIIPFYYLVLFDSDKTQLDRAVSNAIDSLRIGEINAHRLDNKEIALFLKYSNALDFDETEIEKVRPEDYAKWAMPQTVEFLPRVALVNGMVTHNFRLSNYPTVVYDAWLASLLTYPATKVVIKMKPMDSGKAITAIDKSLSELRAKVNSARTDSEAMDASNHLETLQLLLSTLQSENESLLNVNIYVTAYDSMMTQENPKFPDLEYDTYRVRVNNMKKTTRRAWQEAGFRLNNMEFDQATAYIGSQVSGYDPLAKNGRGIPSNTMAATYPWVFPYRMDENGVKLGESDGVPVFLDLFKRDSERVNSNMVIIGKSGSGKSFATKTLLSNLAADGAKIFILDPENEYSELAKNLHGKFINVANASSGRLNPFHIITNLEDEEAGDATSSYASHLQFLEEFFKQILPDCDRDSLEYLNALVDRIYINKGIGPTTNLSALTPESYPTFDDLYDEILREFQRTDNEYIKTMLRTLMNYVSKFAGDGRNALIWNGPSTVTTEENFTVFNFQNLLSNRNSTVANAQMLLVLKYIDNEIIKNRDYNEKYGLNRKIVVVIDEAHVFIDTKYPVALDFMFQLAKRIRKYNGMQIVITQNLKDFVGSEEIARKSTAIINACQYSFIFSLAPNDMDDLCKLYEKAGGINENEQEQIVQAQRGQAFTIISPTSRTSFKVVTPPDVRTMFSRTNYVNPYFVGEGSEENWADFIGDSESIRDENMKSRPKTTVAESAPEESFVSVRFNEIAEEDFEIEEINNAKTALNFEEFEIPEIPETPMEFNAMLREQSIDSVEFEELSQAAASAFAAPQPAVPAASSRTEEILAELALKLGNDSMQAQIDRAVREAVEKELAAMNVQPAASYSISSAAAPIPASVPVFDETPAFRQSPESEESGGQDLFGDLFSDFDTAEEPEETDGGSVLGSIFDFAGLDDLTPEEEAEIDEEVSSAGLDDGFEDDGDDDFDIMSFLAQQADEVVSEETGEEIEDFINGSETVLGVTLEQLMAYIKNQRKA